MPGTFFQHTPHGDIALVHLTGPDVHRALHTMATSQDAWDVQWRAMTHDLHGVDFGQGAHVLPTVTPLYSMVSAGPSSERPFMFVAPLTPGAADPLRALAAELSGPRHADYVRAREQIGVRREAVFLESTGHGDALVVYWLADDPAASLQQLAASTAPFDRWLRAQLAPLHPIGLDALVAIADDNALSAQFARPR